jgi:hypothetical protein
MHVSYALFDKIYENNVIFNFSNIKNNLEFLPLGWVHFDTLFYAPICG